LQHLIRSYSVKITSIFSSILQSHKPFALNPTAKSSLRRSLLQTRQALPPDLWREKSDRLCKHLQACEAVNQAKTILVYNSIRQEPDLSPLFLTSQAITSYHWGLPRCVGNSLVWHLWSPPDRSLLKPGAYGILEPAADSPLLQPGDVDLILVPSVACDRQGYRLGYGGGFYDRLLSDPAWVAKPTIGIVFEFAYLPRLPIDPWDQPLQAVCTESGFYSGRALAD
jgi:5-formyltetrahydrofolate cyclo-ligase